MKTFLSSTFLITLFVFASLSTFLYAQDLSLNTISNAKLTIEFKGKTAYCTTNEKGEFAIYLPDTSKTFIKAKEYKAIMTVDLPNNFKETANNKTLNYMLKQSDAPYYEFTLFYDKSKNQLLIKPNTNIQKWVPPQAQRGQAGKHGDKYVGQVAHF